MSCTCPAFVLYLYLNQKAILGQEKVVTGLDYDMGRQTKGFQRKRAWGKKWGPYVKIIGAVYREGWRGGG